MPTIATVIRTDELSDWQVSDLPDVAAMTPGLVLVPRRSRSVRGFAPRKRVQSARPRDRQSVALNLDGLPLGRLRQRSVRALYRMEPVRLDRCSQFVASRHLAVALKTVEEPLL